VPSPPTIPFQPVFWLENLVVSTMIGALRLLPYRQRVPFAGWVVSHLVAPVAGWRKRVRANLKLVWPDLPEAEVKRLVAGVCDNVGRALAELYSPDEFKAHVKDTPIRGKGLEALLAARARGEPVVMVSGHFGNHDIARAVLAGHGVSIAGLYRPQQNPYINKHFHDALSAISQPMFPRGRRGLAQMVTYLKKGGVLGILVDQHVYEGADLTFLDRRAMTSTSAAELALKYNCLLIPAYGVRQEDGLSFELVVEDPIPRGTPAEMTQAVNGSLERQVTQHPEQWFWIHRRWK
jgi:Kdo2-lipid IVA lauroyltransferase/acyltransferase